MNTMKKIHQLMPPSIIVFYTVVYFAVNRHLPDEDMLLVKPLIYAVIALCLYIGLRDFFKQGPGDAASSTDNGKKTAARVKFILVTAGYLVLIRFMFITASILYLAVVMRLLGVKDKRIIIAVSILLPVCLYLFFSAYLMVPLPTLIERG